MCTMCYCHCLKLIALKLNKTNTNTTAAINISSTSVCGSDYETSGSDDSGYYDYPKVCQGLPSCIISINGYLYTCFDLFTIFGDCSRTLKIPSSKLNVNILSILVYFLNDDRLSSCSSNINSR